MAGREESSYFGTMNSYFMESLYPQVDHHFEAEVMDGGANSSELIHMDRALIASKNHREAERRRRERIKSHLDRLRTILACDHKTDKASLLAKAVERVKDLKQQTAEIVETHFCPTETDEITVLPYSSTLSSDDQSLVFEASLCCEDRADLLSELVVTLRSLRLKPLRAEMTTMGGRIRNVLVLAKEKDENDCDNQLKENIDDVLLLDALKALVHRTMPSERCKRRRLVDHSHTY